MSKPSLTASPEILVLDSPCVYCRHLSFDDSTQNGTIRKLPNGDSYVDFRHLASFKNHSARKQFSPYGEVELELGYRRSDIFPDLPEFRQSALQGCAFCKILRRDLMEAWTCLIGVLPIGERHIRDASLEITGMSYRFEDIKRHTCTRSTTHAECDHPIFKLDSLHVYFTITRADGGDLHWQRKGNDFSIYYRFYTDDKRCATWLQIKRTPIFNSILSQGSLGRLRSLISGFRQSSPAVEQLDKYTPTRLLDVGLDTGVVRLIKSDSGRPLEYATLSYCWGDKEAADQQLKTTKSSIAEHFTQIKLANLPQVASDAIELCRALDIKYIWIDALCIIQDDAADWARESVEMSRIYTESLITFCVLQGTSCLDGFLQRAHSSPTLQIGFSSSLRDEVAGKLLLRMSEPVENILTRETGEPAYRPLKFPANVDLPNAPWVYRAWTFQEAIVSPRKLYIGRTGCHLSFDGLQESVDGTPFTDFLSLLKPSDVPGRRLSVWYQYVHEYSRRQLSYRQDRLPAISAIARTLSQQFPGEEYIAGLWTSDLARGLLWSPCVKGVFEGCTKLLARGYIAPSWSWAHRPNLVEWVDVKGPEALFTPEFEFLESKLRFETNSPFSRALGGHIQIDAKMTKVSLGTGDVKMVQKHPPMFWEVPFEFTLSTSDDQYLAHLQFDWFVYSEKDFLSKPFGDLWMLLTTSCDSSHHPGGPEADEKSPETGLVFGLLLVPTPVEDEFFRVGIWGSKSKDLGGLKFWDGVSKRSIKLV